MEKNVLMLEVHCKNAAFGCRWSGHLQTLDVSIDGRDFNLKFNSKYYILDIVDYVYRHSFARCFVIRTPTFKSSLVVLF